MYFPNKMPHLKLFDFRFFHKSNVFLTNGGSVNTVFCPRLHYAAYLGFTPSLACNPLRFC